MLKAGAGGLYKSKVNSNNGARGFFRHVF